MTLLTATAYPMVRAALGPGVRSGDVPDDVIGLDLYAGLAERDVLAVVPEADTFEVDSDNRLYAVVAAANFCAARLCPAMPRITSLKAGPVSIGQQAIDYARLAAELRQRAFAELAKITTVVPQVPDPTVVTHFTLAGGSRGV